MTIKINDKAAKVVGIMLLAVVVLYGMLYLKNSIIGYLYNNFTAPFLQ